jgi:hypothetical protein
VKRDVEVVPVCLEDRRDQQMMAFRFNADLSVVEPQRTNSEIPKSIRSQNSHNGSEATRAVPLRELY